MFLSTELPLVNRQYATDFKIKKIGRLIGWIGALLGPPISLLCYLTDWTVIDSIRYNGGFIFWSSILSLGGIFVAHQLGPWVAESIQKQKWYQGLWKSLATAVLSMVSGLLFVNLALLVKEISTSGVQKGINKILLAIIDEDLLTVLGLEALLALLPALGVGLGCWIVLRLAIGRMR